MKTRFAYTSDYDEIIKINNCATFHYSDKILLAALNEQLTVATVAVDEEDLILGFCAYHLKTPEVFSIIDVIVHPKFCRQGIGTTLIDKMKQKLNERRNALIHNVFESNLIGQFFLKAMNFKSKLLKSTPEDIIQFRYQKE